MVVINISSPSRLRIQQAIDFVNSQEGGGVVNVYDDVVSDGTTLQLQNNVVLDFHQRTYSFAPSSTGSFDLISCSGGGLSTTSTLLQQDGKQGASRISIAPSSIALFAVDDLVLLESQDTVVSGNLPLHWKYQISKISNIDVKNNELQLSEPLAFNFPVSTSSNIRCVLTPKQHVCLQNIVLNGNGNQGTQSRLLACDGFRDCFFSNIQATGVLTNSVPSDLVTGIHFKHGYNTDIQNISSNGFASGATVRDISFHRMAISTISNIRSLQFSGFGPNLRNATYCIFNGLIAIQSQSRGFRCDTSAFCVLRDIISSGHETVAGTGARLSFSSQRNVLNSVVCVGNADMGFIVDSGCENNQVIGVISAHNTIRPLLFDSSASTPSAARNNFIMGHRIADACDAYEDISRLNTVVEVSDNKGALGGGITQQIGLAPSASVLPTPTHSPGHLYVSQDGNDCIRFSLTGTDGIVRHGYLSLTTS